MNDIISIEVGENLRWMRTQVAYMTQERVAIEADMEKGDISTIESGRRNLTLQTLDRIANSMVCGVKIEVVDVRPEEHMWKPYKGGFNYTKAWLLLKDGQQFRAVLRTIGGTDTIQLFHSGGWTGEKSDIVAWQEYFKEDRTEPTS